MLIVSEAGRLRDSLRVLLKSCYPLAAIAETETCAAVLQRLATAPNALARISAAPLEARFGGEKYIWVLGLLWAVWHYPIVIFQILPTLQNVSRCSYSSPFCWSWPGKR